LAKTPRKWTGARTPSGLKRVRSSERRHAILQPRRTEAKTLVRKALVVATTKPEGEDPAETLAEAMSALDRAAKAGAIHPNAAARRKSRLTRKVNAALGGVAVPSSRVTKSTGTAAAQKAAKARIAAGKAAKAKGAQTAAGKARAALSKTARAEAAAAAAAQATKDAEKAAAAEKAKPAARTTTKAKTPAKPAAKAAAKPKAAPKATAKATAEKVAPKATARAPRAKKTETAE
jgi:ribosomal protein S20